MAHDNFAQRLRDAQDRTAAEGFFGDRPEKVLALLRDAASIMDGSPEDFDAPGLGRVWWTMARGMLGKVIEGVEHVVEKRRETEPGR